MVDKNGPSSSNSGPHKRKGIYTEITEGRTPHPDGMVQLQAKNAESCWKSSETGRGKGWVIPWSF